MPKSPRQVLEDIGHIDSDRIVFQTERWPDDIAITYMEKPRSWRLLKPKTDGGRPDEELVYTLHGVITDKDLPPVAGKNRQR